MNRTPIIAFLAGSIVTTGAAVLIATGPEHKHHNDEPKQEHMAEMSPDEMMAGMMKLATPNEHHADLMKGVGSWSATAKFVMEPDQPPVPSPAKMTVKSMLDGRYAMGHFSMDFMGMPFEGYSIIGYDNAHEQYVSVWFDSMSTKIMYMTGNHDEDGNLVMKGTATTPMGDNPMKIVTVRADDNNWTDMFYDQMPDGTWFNSGTIEYTRD